jgi:hypothetical protein
MLNNHHSACCDVELFIKCTVKWLVWTTYEELELLDIVRRCTSIDCDMVTDCKFFSICSNLWIIE